VNTNKNKQGIRQDDDAIEMTSHMRMKKERKEKRKKERKKERQKRKKERKGGKKLTIWKKKHE